MPDAPPVRITPTRAAIRVSPRRLIERKRDGGRITYDEWHALIHDYAAGIVPDYQMSALLMATFLRGLDVDETTAMTEAMLHSGKTLDLSHLTQPRVDKHSTGGVGDKVSLVLAPLVASLGVAVPMMSGRGLGHTGGTLDKLESIAGFRTHLTLAEARAQIERIGCAMIGQSEEIAPADRRMYALRSATATVESIPLIAASIMSKKLAEGITGLVLDVKNGSGAFLPELERGLDLARTMVELGETHDVHVVALITAMDRPLGRACGNALEVEEAIHALHGEGPADLMEVTFAIGIEMLLLAGVVRTPAAARLALDGAIRSGAAARKFQEIIVAQGGNPGVVDDPAALPQAHDCELYVAPRAGIVGRVEPRAIGQGIIALGGGRNNVDGAVDPTVGFVISARPGDRVAEGEPLATVFARDAEGIATGLAALDEAIVIADRAPTPLRLVSHRVTRRGVEPVGTPGHAV